MSETAPILQIMNSEQHNSYPLISVIVPVYNMEKYLVRCVNSILTQTYPNIEVILVDDGSTDSSPAMCDEFARKDSRVRVIHTRNRGASAARNTGLDCMNGSLVAFADSDDFMQPEMYARLYALMRDNDADIAACEYMFVDEALNEIHDGSLEMTPGVITGRDAFREVIVNNLWHYFLLWNKLCKAEILRTLRLREDFLHEDEEMAGKFLCSCGKMAVTNEKMYIYVKRRGSLIDQARGIPARSIRTFLEMISIIRERCTLLEKLGMTEEAHHYAIKAPYGRALTVLKSVNCIQYRREINGIVFSSLKALASSKEIGYKLRAVKLFLAWLRSMFRPFVKTE